MLNLKFKFNFIVLMLFLASATSMLGQIQLELTTSSFDFPYLDKRYVANSNQFLLYAHSNSIDDRSSYIVTMTIEGNGISMKSNLQSHFAFQFKGAQSRLFTSQDLSSHFDINNLDLSGINRQAYSDFGLPAGVYNVCFEIFNVTSDSYHSVSNKACANLWITKQLPPKITYPKDNAALSYKDLGEFNWMPNHTTISPVEYEVSIYEKFKGVNDNDLLKYYNPIWTGISFSNSLFANDISNYLRDGQEYIVYVRVQGISTHVIFENHGFSDPVSFIYSAPLREKIQKSSSNSCVPSTVAFINELSHGIEGEVNEFIEIVAVGGDSNSEYADLSGLIIDDNNFDAVDVGNESGHIRLGDCFSEIPRGAIILIYDDRNIHAGISQSDDGMPNASGVYQLPISSECIDKYIGCPNMFQDKTDFDCGYYNQGGYGWPELIPMNNLHDVGQLRNEDQELEHALLWGTTSYEFYNTGKTIDFTGVRNMAGKRIAMMHGEDYFDTANFEVSSSDIASPGLPNSTANENLISTIADYDPSGPMFGISCELEFLPTTTAIRINITDDPITTYSLFINDEYIRMFTGDFTRILDVEEGVYTIKVINELTGCEDVCVIEVIFDCVAGTPCDDFNDCTENDVLTEDCKCEGTPLNQIYFTEEPIYQTVCDYCAPLFPWDEETVYNELNITSFTLLDSEGNIITLDNTLNVGGGETGSVFHFPYCIGRDEACGTEDWPTLSTDLQAWLDAMEIEGIVTAVECPVDRTLAIQGSSIEFLTINSISNLGDPYSFEYTSSNCTTTEIQIGTVVTVMSDCESISEVLWSDGSASNPIEIYGGTACYEVEVTCSSGCVFTGVYGEGCECLEEGQQTEECCIVGQPCEPVNPPSCVLEAYWDENCNCIVIEGLDTDHDGVCDDVDICQGHDDADDWDGDGTPDGCDLCQGVDDELYIELINNDDPDDNPECETIPCPEEIEYEFDYVTNGSESCDYCLDLSSFQNNANYDVYFGGINGFYEDEDVYSDILNNWEEIHFSNFDSSDDNWEGVSKYIERYDNANRANSGTYSMRMYSEGAMERALDKGTPFLNPNKFICQLRVDFSFIAGGLEYSNESIHLEYSDENGLWHNAGSWYFNNDFNNNERQNKTLYIDDSFGEISKLRFRVSTNLPIKGGFFVDDIRVQKLARKKTINECMVAMGDVDGFVNHLDKWITDLGGSHEGIKVFDSGYEGCGTDGLTVVVRNSTVGLTNVEIEGGNTHLQYDFESPNCESNYPGQIDYDVTVNANCEDATYEWSNGETTQTINIPFLASYIVTVTCGDDCEYVLVFDPPNPDCVVGEVCYGNGDENDSSCVGVINEYCECIVEVTPINDIDEDGIPDCIDPCEYLDVHDANGNGILDCEECRCNDEPYLVATPVGNGPTSCSMCVELDQGQGDYLHSVIYNGVDLTSYTEIFHFPYENDTIFHAPDDPSNWHLYGLNHFFADFYTFHPNNQDLTPVNDVTVDMSYTLKGSCGNSVFSAFIEGLNSGESLQFIFSNSNFTSYSGNCSSPPAGYNVSLVIDNCSACANDETIQYQWSDGSTEPIPNAPLDNLDQGYAVTITCEGGCTYEIYPDWEPDCIIGAPCDDGDPCTVDDEYVLGNEYGIECFCQGIVPSINDEDGDGVLDSCDICRFFDDNIDTDFDGVPNGCDICEGGHDALLLDDDPTNDPENCQDCNPDYEPTICSAKTGIPARFCNQNTFIRGFTVAIPGYSTISVQYGLNTAGLLHFPYCWDNNGPCAYGTPIDDFQDDLNAWLMHMGYGGTASVDISSAYLSLTIENTELIFQNLNWDCGASTRSNRNPGNFEVDCGETLENVTGVIPDNPSANIFNTCDDGNECTLFDSFNENCECEGVYMDSDDDTVCDPLDQCPNWPDYLGCSEYVECLYPNPTPPDYATDEIHLCEFFHNLASNAENSDALSSSPKVIQQSIDEIMCMLNELINDPEFNGENFNIPGLIDQVQSPFGANDEDDDGVINLLDIFPYDDNRPSGGYYDASDFEYPGFCEDHFAKIGTFQDPRDLILPAALFVRSFLFVVVNDNYSSSPSEGCDYAETSCPEPANMPDELTPGCAAALGLAIYEDESCILREESTGCAVYFYIDCDGNCQYYTTGDYDGNGVCGNETIVTGCENECEQPEDYPCQVWGLNPETCECEPIGDNYDDDGDGVCNADDICPDGDDNEDMDGDGIPDACDDCDSGGIGDPCDDGNPCTYADHVIELANGTCDCQGVAVDTDGDGVYDCDGCDAAVDTDGDGYIDQVNTWTFDHEWPDGTIETLTACDVCPELDDTIDENEDGLPDCVAPPFYPIGCPENIEVIADQGLLLTFPSDNITQDQLPQPIDLTYIFEGGVNNQITTENYLLYDYVRETDGVFEVFYSLPSLSGGDYSYLAVSYADHQPCILGSDTPLSELNCPDLVEYKSNNSSEWLQMDFSIPEEYSYDILSIAGAITFNPGIGNPAVNEIEIESNFVTAPFPNQVSIDFYGIEGLGDLSNYVGTITLPNGSTCPINGGTTTTECTWDEEDVSIGDPCDDGDDCTHHDKIQADCSCLGEPKPDTDEDGVCDEFDECTGDPNDPDDDAATMNDPDTGLCPCPELVLTPVGLVNGNDFEIELDMSIADQFSNLSVSITGGPEDTTLDMGFSSPLVVPNLIYGYTYAIVITGECANGGTSVASTVIDVPFGEEQFFCGISLTPQDLTSTSLLTQLNVNDEITAADFIVNVRESSGSYGTFSGKGYISVPYLNFVRINVTFENIIISEDYQMISGCIDVAGYGLAILGDAISDAINDAVNDIINVLEDISDILEDLIPLLEDIEELVETTGNLVSEETKNCIEDAKEDLEALQVLAEGPNPPEDIADQIKAATVVLEQCHQAYQDELALILDQLLVLYNNSLTTISNDCIANNNYQTEFDNSKTNLNQQIPTASDFIQTLPSVFSNGTGLGILTVEDPNPEDAIFDAPEEHVTNLDPLFVSASDSFFDEQKRASACIFMSKLFESLNGASEFSVAQMTEVLQVLLQISEDFASEMGEAINSNMPQAELQALSDEKLETAIINFLMLKYYGE